MKKPICDWSDDDIKHLIAEYTKSGKTEGGDYSLGECHREITRRRMIMKKPICDWTDDEIRNLVENYVRLNKTDGGQYSLFECNLEITRRLGGEYSGREVTKAIVNLSKASADGLVTYLELFQFFHPESHWQGHASLRITNRLLDAATYYCATNGPLPMVTSVVVQQGARTATVEAKENLYKRAKELGIPTGPDHIKFFDEHAERTKRIDPSVFDADRGSKPDVD